MREEDGLKEQTREGKAREGKGGSRRQGTWKGEREARDEEGNGWEVKGGEDIKKGKGGKGRRRKEKQEDGIQGREKVHKGR